MDPDSSLVAYKDPDTDGQQQHGDFTPTSYEDVFIQSCFFFSVKIRHLAMYHWAIEKGIRIECPYPWL